MAQDFKNDFARSKTTEEVAEVLNGILDLSKKGLAHTANQAHAFPVRFFRTDRDENNNLREEILNAILDDCSRAGQAIRLAVEWGDSKLTRNWLKASPPPRASALRSGRDRY